MWLIFNLHIKKEFEAYFYLATQSINTRFISEVIQPSDNHKIDDPVRPNVN